MHFNLTLPSRIAAGVARDSELMVDKVRTVGGHEVRNQEWETELRSWEVPFPNMKSDDADFLAVLDLWKTVDGETHTFDFFDEIEGDTARVRFEGKLRVSHVAGPMFMIDTLLLVEQRA